MIPWAGGQTTSHQASLLFFEKRRQLGIDELGAAWLARSIVAMSDDVQTPGPVMLRRRVDEPRRRTLGPRVDRSRFDGTGVGRRLRREGDGRVGASLVSRQLRGDDA